MRNPAIPVPLVPSTAHMDTMVIERHNFLVGTIFTQDNLDTFAASATRQVPLPGSECSTDDPEETAGASKDCMTCAEAGRQFNFGLSFGLKNHLSFTWRFPTLRKCSKMGSLDTSENTNGISSRFSNQNSSQNCFY